MWVRGAPRCYSVVIWITDCFLLHSTSRLRRLISAHKTTLRGSVVGDKCTCFTILLLLIRRLLLINSSNVNVFFIWIIRIFCDCPHLWISDIKEDHLSSGPLKWTIKLLESEMPRQLISQESLTAFTDQATVQTFFKLDVFLLSSSTSHSLSIWLFIILNKFMNPINALYSLLFGHLPKEKWIVYLERMPNLEAVISVNMKRRAEYARDFLILKA